MVGNLIKLSDASPKRRYIIKKIVAPSDAERLIMTHGLVPGNVIVIRNQKNSRRAFFVEILFLNRLISISKSLADFVLVEEWRDERELDD